MLTHPKEFDMALSPPGLRALRYAREIEGIGQVVALDNDKGPPLLSKQSWSLQSELQGQNTIRTKLIPIVSSYGWELTVLMSSSGKCNQLCVAIVEKCGDTWLEALQDKVEKIGSVPPCV